MKVKFFSCMLLMLFFLSSCGTISFSDVPANAPTEITNTPSIEESTEQLSEQSSTESIDSSEEPIEELSEEFSEEIVEEPIPNTLTISFAGDCALGKILQHDYPGSFWNYYDDFGPDYFFQNVRTVFENDDATIVNLECVFTNSDDPNERTYNIKGFPEYNQILANSSIEGVTNGNNHKNDYKEVGVNDTVASLKEIDMPYAYDGIVGEISVKDYKIGYVSVSVVSWGNDSAMSFFTKGIDKCKENNCDIIIACPHWGIEGEYIANSDQQQMGRSLIDLGADIVVGCHPHVLEGFEKYNDKYIIYSLGNFCFGANRNPSDKNSMIVQATFDMDNDKAYELNIIPCKLSSVNNKNDFCPTIQVGEEAEAILSKLDEYSEPFGLDVNSDGTLSVIAKEE